MKEDRYQHVLCKNYKIKWMEDLNTSNIVYCFIFIYYQSIFKRLSKDDQLAIEEFEYSDDEYKRYNLKLQKMCKEIEKLENIEDAENSMYSKSRFIRLIESFVNESFTDAFDIPDILWNMSDKHPLFSLEMTVKHYCEKYDQLTFVSSQSSDTLVIIASFLNWSQRNTRDTNLVFEDNFIYTPMSETDLGIHYTCCNANEFYPFFKKLPRFLVLHLNYNKKLKNKGMDVQDKPNTEERSKSCTFTWYHNGVKRDVLLHCKCKVEREGKTTKKHVVFVRSSHIIRSTPIKQKIY